jgi:hypothetical protein
MTTIYTKEMLFDLAHRLEAKYGVQAGIFHEKGKVLLEKIETSTNPIHPEEIDAICKETAAKFNLKTDDIAYTTRDGNILVYFSQSGNER